MPCSSQRPKKPVKRRLFSESEVTQEPKPRKEHNEEEEMEEKSDILREYGGADTPVSTPKKFFKRRRYPIVLGICKICGCVLKMGACKRHTM